jgi:hypothetical protein
MTASPTHLNSKPSGERWFYSIASIALLAFTFLGFQLFYLQGKAFPGRDLTPPIKPLLITHGVLMTAWMLLSVAQPLLVASGRKRVHMALGRVGGVLALGIVISGFMLAVRAARVNPPELRLFGLVQMEFLAVPLNGIVMFGGFVLVGMLNRRRPEVHRPLMFMASLAAVPAALGRIPPLNGWYAGTQLEYWLSAFVIALLVGIVLLGCKCAASRSVDRWFAGAFGVLAASWLLTAPIARTPAWEQFAMFLIR